MMGRVSYIDLRIDGGCQFKKVLNFKGTQFLICRFGEGGKREEKGEVKGMAVLFEESMAVGLANHLSLMLDSIHLLPFFSISNIILNSDRTFNTTILHSPPLIIYNFMLVRKVLSLQKKQPQPRPPYKKPVYKSYKELLHLDRPRKKIEYESQSSDEDFLERLLNEEAQRSLSKKKRKKTAESAKRRGSQERQRADKNVGKEDAKGQRKGSTEIKLIRQSNGRTGSANNERNSNELALIKEEKANEAQAPTIKFIKNPSNDSLQNRRNSIYIDNKSIECPAITYSSTNHLFRSTLKERKGSGYQLLLAARKEYEQQTKTKESVDLLQDNKIQYKVEQLLEAKFRFAPKIDPITPNWRYNLTVVPIQITQHKEFVDRKTLFRSQQEEDRFVRSLRELSRRKY